MSANELPPAVSFQDGPIDGVVLRPLQRFSDPRGWLVELFRQDELPRENVPAMAYISETLPGVVRGPHEHVEQSDYFAFLGPGDFKLYLWDARPGSPTSGRKMAVIVGESNPQSAIVPPGVVHAYKNVSSAPGLVFNSPNRLFAGKGKAAQVDEIRHEENEGTPYVVD